MRYISIFSGIEAASVAWMRLGWEPVAFSEIEPFPCELLKKRFPDVPNLGDITKIDWTPYGGAVDVVIGGSPCQSFSIAGKHEGLKGESGLMFEFIRAVRGIRPAYFVWENVPGALSSEGGEAFRQLLCEMDDIGYGLAWRVLDAQFFGVPQRRRRLFLVGSYGSMRCAEVLSEPGSLRWDSQSSREKRQELARYLEEGSGRCHEMKVLPFCMPVITSPYNGNNPLWGDPCHTIAASDYAPHVVCMDGERTFVRKLTPLECERLQGFPDGWTDLGNTPDAPRYKALGNSMAVPVINWIGKRIEETERMNDGKATA